MHIGGIPLIPEKMRSESATVERSRRLALPKTVIFQYLVSREPGLLSQAAAGDLAPAAGEDAVRPSFVDDFNATLAHTDSMRYRTP
jgi:hypothetical protein